MFNVSSDQTFNYAYFPILLKDEKSNKRDRLYEVLREENIYSRKYFSPLTSDLACFKNRYRGIDVKNARDLSRRVLVLPMYEGLSLDTVKRIAGIVCETMR